MESFVKNISYPRYVASNITNPTCPTSESSVEMVAKASAYAIILVVSLVGNSILILSIAKNEQSRKSIHYLVLNMAVSDLLNSFTIMPIKLAQIISASGSWKVVRPWLLGNLLCKLSYFLIDVSLVVSIESLLLISVDRFIAVVFPLKAKLISSKVRLVGVLWTWIVATVVHAPYFYAYKLTPEGNETLCRLDWGPAFDHKKTHKRFVTATFIIFILVPIGVFAMVYGTIAWKLRRNNRKHKQQLGFRHKSRDEQHKKIVRIRLHENGILESEIATDIFEGLVKLRILSLDSFIVCCYAKKATEGLMCVSPQNEFSSCEDMMKNPIIRFCLWILSIVALVGNLSVIFWRLLYGEDSKVQSFLLKNLAVADFLMGVYLIILAVQDTRWQGEYFEHDVQWRGGTLCQVTGALSMLSAHGKRGVHYLHKPGALFSTAAASNPATKIKTTELSLPSLNVANLERSGCINKGFQDDTSPPENGNRLALVENGSSEDNSSATYDTRL
ncbi:G-protein coupled receptor GRL101 [Stylophora pistillata]|uniref:G-protein coupled receptor GRL101 n=1 Tax=Stylophora pistillata TaxID=50429 RepID=A0A2B4R636_STYPI|nr:G-protein coupled receptor GRL101 [Stylophora pistillata]